MLFVENARLWAILSTIRAQTPRLKTIVVFDPARIDPQPDCTPLADLRSDAVQVDERAFVGLPAIFADDTATIVYTSGTTGDPKGAVLTHGNIVFNAFAAIDRFKVTEKDVFLSFLPLCHMFERTCGYYTILFAGGTIGYAEDLSTVVNDVLMIRPTVGMTVPRVIERARDKIAHIIATSSPFRRALVEAAIRNLNELANRRYRRQPIPLLLRLKCKLYDALVARKFRAIAGGRLRVLVSGGAPLNRELAKLFLILGFNIVEGYGLTETAPIVSCGLVEENVLGTVGRPLDGVEVRIGENDEILVRGPNVMKGYFNRPEETAQAIDPEGWFHTGDQGRFDEHGNLVITGRIKELIVSSTGKKIAPAPIEEQIARSPFIDQVLLCGDQRHCVAALVVPQRAAIERYAAQQGIPAATYEELLGHEAIRRLIARETAQVTATLSSYEKVRRFVLIPEPFTQENGLMTPTLKLRRGKILQRYAAEVDSMYAGQRSSEDS